jgi:uncharacterized protein (TIGR02145 family)
MSHLPAGYLLSGRYSIQRSLGQGGFGITYLAYDTKLEIEVCVKEHFRFGVHNRLNTGEVEHRDAKEHRRWLLRFLEEARHLQAVEHVNVVRVYEVLQCLGTAYMVMEFVEGENLREWVRRERPSERWALITFAGLLDAVEAVHRAGLLHRDIKPVNVMLSEQGRVVLVDFGSAWDFSNSGAPEFDWIMSHGFAPIEQSGAHYPQGTSTDVYALGATLYYLLTGVRPIPSMDRFNEELRSPRTLFPEIGCAVSDATMKAMALLPRDRYATVQEFREALGIRSEDAAPSVLAVKPAPRMGRLVPHTRRHVKWALGLGGLLMWTGWLIWRGEETRRSREEAAANEAYFGEKPWTCGSDQVVFDGHAYETVQVGNQCWFKENLRTTVFANGAALQGNLRQQDWANASKGAQALYDDKWVHLEEFGRLYNVFAIQDARGLCPAGWHVPEDEDWQQIKDYINSRGWSAVALKASNAYPPRWDGTNVSGFSALPGGMRNQLGYDEGLGEAGGWWSASKQDGSEWVWTIRSKSGALHRSVTGPQSGHSVRCICDDAQ